MPWSLSESSLGTEIPGSSAMLGFVGLWVVTLPSTVSAYGVTVLDKTNSLRFFRFMRNRKKWRRVLRCS
jgi:hypothetical protein